MLDLCIHIVKHYSFDPSQYPDAIAEYALPIIVGIMALLFPILFTAIARLDDKYKSDVIYQRFLKDTAYKGFCVTLVIALVFSSCYVALHGFIIEIGGFTDCLIVKIKAAFLIISVVALIIFTFIVICRLLKYYNPSDLYKLIRDNENKVNVESKEVADIIATLYAYSASVNNIQLFDKINSDYIENSDGSQYDAYSAVKKAIPLVNSIYIEQKIAILGAAKIEDMQKQLEFCISMVNNGEKGLFAFISQKQKSLETFDLNVYKQCEDIIHTKGVITEEDFTTLKGISDIHLVCLVALSESFVNKKYELINRVFNTQTEMATLQFAIPANFYQVVLLYVEYKLVLNMNPNYIDSSLQTKFEKDKMKDDIEMFFAFLFVYFAKINFSAGKEWLFKNKDFVLRLFDMRTILYKKMEYILNDAEIRNAILCFRDNDKLTPRVIVSQIEKMVLQSEIQIILDSKEKNIKLKVLTKLFEKSIDDFYKRSGISNQSNIDKNYTFVDTVVSDAEISKRCLIDNPFLSEAITCPIESVVNGIVQDAMNTMYATIVKNITNTKEYDESKPLVNILHEIVGENKNKYRILCPFNLQYDLRKMVGEQIVNLPQIIYIKDTPGVKIMHLINVDDWLITPATSLLEHTDISHMDINIQKDEAILNDSKDDVTSRLTLVFSLNKKNKDESIILKYKK